MKNQLLIALFLLFSAASFGQKIRFCDKNNRWKVKEDYPYSATGSLRDYHYLYDTLMNGYTYEALLFYTFYEGHTYFVREDTVIGKVYVRINDSIEDILYDYNWQLGDSVCRNIAGQVYTHYVDGIDSTLINSVWYKVWHFGPLINLAYYVIEGIGCTQDPRFPLAPLNQEDITTLICFSNTGGNPVVTPAVYYFDNYESCKLGIDESAIQYKTTRIIPNPTNGTSKIVFSHDISSGSLIIVNQIGQTIANLSFQNKVALQIGDKLKLPGIYYYRVTDNENGEVFFGKFLNQ